MKKGLKRLLKKFRCFLLNDLAYRNEVNSLLLAKLNIRRILETEQVKAIRDAEFKVFSQFGEDGIIQYLINNIPIANEIFVEFGVENYTESNTRLLLMNNNWKGLVIDGGSEYIEYIKNDNIYWKHDLTAICRFITRENINDIISGAGIKGDIGLMSIDIDGNDYWVWDAINIVNPRIVICEYNSIFGSELSVTIPYNENFVREKVHYSNLYFGASLAALYDLGRKKGYDFVGITSAGNNAFFVRKDISDFFRKCHPKEDYTAAKFRDSRDIKGKLNYLSAEEGLREIAEMEVYNIRSGKNVLIGDLFKQFP